MFAVFRPSRKIARGADRLRISAFWPKADCRPAPDQQPTTFSNYSVFFCEREDARSRDVLTRRICWLGRWNPRQRHADAAAPQHAIIRPSHPRTAWM